MGSKVSSVEMMLGKKLMLKTPGAGLILLALLGVIVTKLWRGKRQSKSLT